MKHNTEHKMIFWGSFVALITTSMAFIIRAILIGSGVWSKEFGLDGVQAGELFGAGIWPFAISIIIFSLIIDYVGYKTAMFFSFFCYAVFGVLAMLAYSIVNAEGVELVAAQAEAWNYIYWGSVILGLGNGTVEAFINPVVATIFKDEKAKWLNILHAGWPGGLVLGGILGIALAEQNQTDWRIYVGLMFIPAIIYLVMLFKVKFPENERVSSGSSYKDMLSEFGVISAFIAFFLIFAQLSQVIPGWTSSMTWIAIIASVGAFGFYCKSIGNPLLIVLILIMMPLAATELGTDGAITGLMSSAMAESGGNPAWVLVYTSLIMMILRFNAGPVIKKLTPLGLLTACALLSIVGLYLLSFAHGLIFIFAAATIYGVAKTYFWPTMLGVVSEQTPKGGALTINAIAGIGMLTVGILANPFIGYLQESSVTSALQEEMPAIHKLVTMDKDYVLGDYTALNNDAVSKLPGDKQAQVTEINKRESQGALAKMAIFPVVMLIGYIGLLLYFRSRGGYKPKVIG